MLRLLLLFGWLVALLPAPAVAQGTFALVPAQGLPNFSTSSRGPDGSQRYHRAAMIYPAADLPAVAPATDFVSLGFQLRTPAATAATGTLRVWLRATTDATYSLAPDWAYLLQSPAPFTLVYDGPLTIPATAGWFDVPLTTPFRYGGGGLYLVYEWVATTTSAASAAYECNNNRIQSIQVATGTTPPAQLTQTSSFRPVVRLGYTPPTADAELVRLFLPGTLPQQRCVQPFPVQALVRNAGTQPLLNLPVTLTASGAASGSQTVVVPQLAPGATQSVHFPLLTPTSTGRIYVQATLPPDGNAANNTRRDSAQATTRTLTYVTGSPAVPSSAVGFDRTAGSLLCRYPLTAPALVGSVRVCLATNTASVGQTVFGVLLDAQGALLARSADFVVRSTDLGNWRTLALPAPTLVTGRACFAGLVQTPPAANGPRYYPLGTQAEQPARDSAYYSVAGDSALTGLKRPQEVRTLNRFMVELDLESAPLATAGPRAAPEWSMYPNPAHDQVYVRWPNRPAGPLRVEVLDAAGRARHQHWLPDPAVGLLRLPLPPLPAGLYLVRLTPLRGPGVAQRLLVE